MQTLTTLFRPRHGRRDLSTSPRAGHGDNRSSPAMRHELDRLEPRIHLAAFTFQSIPELFNLPSILHELAPPAGVETAGYGFTAIGLGDIDGDGRGDFAIAAPGRLASGDQSVIPGRVFLYSGASGALLRTLSDGAAEFGFALASLGDVDGDGVPDLVVGSPSWADGDGIARGQVVVFSGANGSVLHTLMGPGQGAEYGRVLAALPDITGDGVSELVIGAPGAGPQGQGQVFIRTFSDALVPGGELIHTFTGEGAGDRFGAAVFAVMLDTPHVLIGAPLNDAAGADAGRAYLYQAALGAGELRLTLTGEQPGEHFGTAVAAGTRFDGATILMIGAPNHTLVFGDFQIVNSGRIYRFDTAGELAESDGTIHGSDGERAGAAITAIGDITGNGRMDFAYRFAGDEATQQIRIARGPARGDLVLIGTRIPAGLRDFLFGIGDIDGDGAADLLAASPAAQQAVALSSLELLTPQVVFGGNQDLTFLFASSLGNVIGGMADYAFINGVFLRQSEIPGVGLGTIIIDVNNDHVIVGRLFSANDQGFAIAGEPFIVTEGVRTLLRDAAVQIVGPHIPVWENMEPIRITNSGHIIFHERPNTSVAISEQDRAWVFHDGVLTFLWHGDVADVNEHGAVVGRRFTAPATTQVVLRQPGGQETIAQGLDIGQQIDDSDRVVGVAPGARLAQWVAGEVTILAEPHVLPGALPFWTVLDASTDGRVLARSTRIIGRSVVTQYHLFTPEEGLLRVDDLIFGTGGLGQSVGNPILFAEGGLILTGSGVLMPVDEQIVWSFQEGAPTSAAAGAVLGINPLGDPILLRQVGDRWVGERINVGRPPTPALPTFTDALLIRSPATGDLYAALTIDGRSYFGRFVGGEFPLFLSMLVGPESESIASSMTGFFTADDRFIIAGLDGQGELTIFFQPFSGSNAILYNNLVHTHLAARGQSFTPAASNLTAFGTPWGTDHIAYLDADGQIHVVWWAPGHPLWRTDQISTVDGTGGPLSGTLTSMVTPWRTLHFLAHSALDHITAVWWAPGFGGQWEITPLASGNQPRFAPDSVSTFQTPWNALNIVGRDAETGELLVYWWAPATQVWAAEHLTGAGAPDPLIVTGSVHGATSPDGTMDIFARQPDGDVARLFWNLGDGTSWSYQNLTALVAGTS